MNVMVLLLLKGFDFWVLLPLLLLGAFAYIVWKKYMDIKDELRARKTEMRSFNENYFNAKGGVAGGAGGTGGASGAGARSGSPDRKEVERLIANSNVIADLNEAIGKLQLRVSKLEGKGVAATPVPPIGGKIKQKASQDGILGDVFYMAGPVNNYFPNSAKSMTKDNTVYKFKLNANKQEAEYELHTSGAPIMEIVQLAESYIKAACDEENLPTYPVKNIITKKTGQAILEGDKWVIKSKALIRYE
jgi:hypothetical protein